MQLGFKMFMVQLLLFCELAGSSNIRGTKGEFGTITVSLFAVFTQLAKSDH